MAQTSFVNLRKLGRTQLSAAFDWRKELRVQEVVDKGTKESIYSQYNARTVTLIPMSKKN